MRIPGFAATHAITAASGHWQGAPEPVLGSIEDKVVPQFCFTNPGGRTTCCYCDFGWCYCHIPPRVLSM